MMFIPSQGALKRVFALSIAGTRGGPVRMEILKMLSARGTNINQMAVQLGVDYKTAQHHVRVLERNGFVKKQRQKNEIVYALSDVILSNRDAMKEIKNARK